MASTPRYLEPGIEALRLKAQKAFALLERCSLCPRHCGIDRIRGQKGFCRTGALPVLSSYGPHFGEEPPLVGRIGSGTVFFCNCNMGCIFCQNHRISQGGGHPEASHEALASIMLELKSIGCHNLNLVTPTHQMPMILKSLCLAVERGFDLPIVYNCGGYESIEALTILDGIVDIYMPDIKFFSGEAALELADAPGYPEAARNALREMHRQVGDLKTDTRGIATNGLLVRHLVLPGGLAGSAGWMEFIAREIAKETAINIMDQYHPCHRAFSRTPLNRRLRPEEFDEAIGLAKSAGLRPMGF